MLISMRCQRCGNPVTRDVLRMEREIYERDGYSAYCQFGYRGDTTRLFPRKDGCGSSVFFTSQLLKNYKLFVKVHGEFVGDFA